MLDSLKMLSSNNNIKTLLTITSLLIGIILQTLNIIAGRLGRPNFSDQDIDRLRACLGEESFATVEHLIGNPNTTFDFQEILAVGKLFYRLFWLISSIYRFFAGLERQSDGNIYLSILCHVHSLASIVNEGINYYKKYNSPSPSGPLRQLVDL